MAKSLSPSARPIAAMHQAALKALTASPNGQLGKDQILQAIASTVAFDDWAREMYDNGNMCWRSIFAFASVGLVKGSYVTKSRGLWTITDAGRAVATSPCDCPALPLRSACVNFSRSIEKYFCYKRFAKLESFATHPPHVLVSTKVLLQSRRAKGGFSFGAEACNA